MPNKVGAPLFSVKPVSSRLFGSVIMPNKVGAPLFSVEPVSLPLDPRILGNVLSVVPALVISMNLHLSVHFLLQSTHLCNLYSFPHPMHVHLVLLLQTKRFTIFHEEP